MNARERILDAAGQVMRSRGLAHATTKEIAKAAGCSEAALYKHFRGKTDLFVAVLGERVPSSLGPLLDSLHERVGRATVRGTLDEVARAAIAFYSDTFPMAASLFSEPDLLAAHRAALHQRGTGPQHVPAMLAAYLAAEQRAGGISLDVDPDAAARLLLGACLQQAFLRHFTEQETDTDILAAELVRTLVAGLLPGQ